MAAKQQIIDMGFPHPNTIKANKELYQQICHETEFLNEVKEVSVSLRLFCILNNIQEIPLCKECKQNQVSPTKMKRKGHPYMGFAEFCCRSCATKNKGTQEKHISTTLERFGTEHASQSESIKEKVRQTNLERYGVEYAMQSEELKKKFEQNSTDKYGVPYPIMNAHIRAKANLTFETRYGGNPLGNVNIREKIKQTNLERYGTEHIASSKEFICKNWGFSNIEYDLLNDKEWIESHYAKHGSIQTACEHLPFDAETYARRLKQFNIPIRHTVSSSIGESELLDFISSLYDGTIERSNKTVLSDRRHLDIYLPDAQIAFEYNGVYWHSEAFKPKDYHQTKTLECMDQGIRLFHIWEDDWLDPNKQSILKTTIRHIFGKTNVKVNARECSIEELDFKQASEFLNKYHIQGSCNASVYIGLFHHDMLVACLLMKQKQDNEWSLVRYASSVSVRGGFSKLLSHFKKMKEWKKIETFARLDTSDGSLYCKTGFVFEHITTPIMFYVSTGNQPKRYNREKFMKYKLSTLLENFDPNITEHENMRNHGFLRLYDSGLMKFSMSQ